MLHILSLFLLLRVPCRSAFGNAVLLFSRFFFLHFEESGRKIKPKMSEMRIIANVHATHSTVLNNAQDGSLSLSLLNRNHFSSIGTIMKIVPLKIGPHLTVGAFCSLLFSLECYCWLRSFIHTLSLTKMNCLKIYHIRSILNMAQMPPLTQMALRK